ncbi:putative RNA-binding Zn ribbon-like protein [Actinoplanes tereljensis]|uniref:Zinc finger CGNR domain-containing protein n=1 Tax=Paractinoplanes tereljensis TaxID=571912 RepID=A0A919NP30_9ACTN|nr:CGNR zinc finger domain-containing protein [Actinoplanes tereljensis]GIF21461.1 hypothetical protein Ate02nite_41910 [Actinoplanes tereljensis]
MLSIVGGHLALDLANTVTADEEFLPDLPAVLAWAQRLEVVTPAEAALVERAPADTFGEVHRLRTLVGETLAGRHLATLTARWAEAIARSELCPVPAGGATLSVGRDPATMIGDRLTVALADLLQNADLSLLRTCPACGFRFLDRSRNRSRRWCSMADCGTNVKVKRLTERRRSTAESRKRR